eukprot:6060169-Alexandrium_andersonii.AAC.1
MSASLVGSGDVYKRQVAIGFERARTASCSSSPGVYHPRTPQQAPLARTCLLYTSDAADDM